MWPLTGTNFFPSRARCCPSCRSRTITVGADKVTEYYHAAVVCHLVGFDLALPLDVEPVRPGETEPAAAMRLLARVFRNYPRFFDAVVGDALYLQGPFFNFCLAHGKHVMAVLKGNNPALLEDARGLLSEVEPVDWQEGARRVLCWDMEGFTTNEGIEAPLRVMHTEETVVGRHRIAGEWVSAVESQSWWWATTIPAMLLSAPRLCRAGHARWDVENDLFNVLATDWHLDHCCKHEPNAIINFVLTLFIAFVLVQSFYKQNLKPEPRRRFTLIGLALELLVGLAEARLAAAWSGRRPTRSPP